LQKGKLKTENQIRKMYSQNSECFDAALRFLIRLGIVRKNGRSLALCNQPPSESPSDKLTWLISRLLCVRNRYRSEIFRYVRNFRLEAGELVYRPFPERRSSESGVRNFLMEMKVVRHEREHARYVLSYDFIWLHAHAEEPSREVSPSRLRDSLAARDELGLLAERAIIEFEKKRLGNVLAGEVDHVALRNVAAGYDIRSLTVSNDSETVPRFIEVKAVSPVSMCFHWTRNEVAVACTLRDFYFLYLLPVTGSGGFDVANLRIICDPHKRVLGSPQEWVIETELIRCGLRTQSGQHSHTTGALKNV